MPSPGQIDIEILTLRRLSYAVKSYPRTLEAVLGHLAYGGRAVDATGADLRYSQ
jgi:hypothetical protein